jgi:hypothetical protein
MQVQKSPVPIVHFGQKTGGTKKTETRQDLQPPRPLITDDPTLRGSGGGRMTESPRGDTRVTRSQGREGQGGTGRGGLEWRAVPRESRRTHPDPVAGEPFQFFDFSLG